MNVFWIDWVSFLNKPFNETCVSIIGSFVQRGTIFIVWSADRSTLFMQKLDDGLVILPRRLPQCCSEVRLLGKVETQLHFYSLIQHSPEVPFAIKLPLTCKSNHPLLLLLCR